MKIKLLAESIVSDKQGKKHTHKVIKLNIVFFIRITHVHRFIVKNTLEERIYEMFKNNIGIEGNLSGNIRETSENAMITIKDIQKLFTGT